MFWDFDHFLQKTLLSLLKTVTTPDEIARLCIERWKINLKRLAEGRRRDLHESIAAKTRPSFNSTPRDEFVLARIKPRGRFLYIGCGTGTECFRFADKGLSVIGIDTDAELLQVAYEWKQYIDSAFEPICMDVMNLGFAPQSFDGFLLEFYGHQPAYTQVLNLQQNLEGILNDSGVGFIVAGRKKYSSFWYRMGSRYPVLMTKWLIQQSKLDFHFSEQDGNEEILSHGLFSRYHTTNSLATELSNAFDIVECMYESYDPRYAMCVVKRKRAKNPDAITGNHFETYQTENRFLRHDTPNIENILSRICSICEILELHEMNVVQYFDAIEDLSTRSPFRDITTDLSHLIGLLEETF